MRLLPLLRDSNLRISARARLPIAPELGPGPVTCLWQPASNLQKHVFGIRVLPLSSVGAAGGLQTICTLSLSMPYNWPDVPTCHHTAGLQPIESEHGLVDRYERGLSEITATPLVLPSLDKGIYGANVCSLDT